MAMGFPETYHLIFIGISIILFVLIIDLLFTKRTFEKTVAGFIFCFINIVICFLTGLGFFAIDFFSFDSAGVIVSNVISDYSSLGFVFIGLSYISFIMLLYCVYLFYEKPWNKTRKITGNPYV